MDIKSLAEKHENYIIEQRRYFHAHPELSLQEVETTKAIKKQLEDMNIEVRTFLDYTGLVGYIKSGKKGKTVMLRADIDALPVLEKTNLPFASVNEGVMHACGHDSHISMLLGGAKILSEIRDTLDGDVVFLFQAAEETGKGADYYIKNGVLDGVDGIFGMHIWGHLEAPYINIEDGGRMASCDTFTIKIKGTSAHGSTPQDGNDAIVAAASTILNLQTFVSRRNDPLNTLVVTIGTIHGGQRFNIIANEVVMDGSIRTYDREFIKTILNELHTIVDNTCAAFGCTAEIDYDPCLPPVINDKKELTKIARDAVIKLYGEDGLKDMNPLTVSEDFSKLMETVPGVFGFIGSMNEEKGINTKNHNDAYTVDESTLQRGAALYAQFAVDFLKS